MPALIPIIIGVLLSVAFRFLVAIGLGFLTFTVALPEFHQFIQQYFTQLPQDVINIIGVLRIDIAMTIILSAAAAKLIYKISAAPLISLGR